MMNKLLLIIFIFFLSPSILLGDGNIDWKKCLGKLDNSSSWSSKPSYCYNKENLKLFSEEEIKEKILKNNLIKNKLVKQIDYSKYKTVLFEDFSKKFKFKKIKKDIKKFEYFLPSEPYWKAFTNSMKIIDEEMIISIKPGTRQWDGDERSGTERAEWGFYVVDGKKLIQRDKIIKLSYDFKLPANSSHLFINEKRILISQVKFDGGKFPGFSPPFAFYVHKGGAATCVDYNNQRTSKNLQTFNHTKIPKEINIYDGEWHKVEFIFKLGRYDGYCLIKIDGKKIIEKFNYDNDLDPNEQIVSRFGPYRDESKNTHKIYFDNIEVGYFDKKKKILFADTKIKYETFKELPCKFNGAKIDSPAAIAFKNSSRCSKAKGYALKRGTSILVKRGTPVFAVTDMKLLYAKDRSAKQRSKIYNETQKKQGIDYIFDDVELMFIDKNQNQILFYHLMDTPFVPGFGKGNCERPLEFGTEKYKRNPNYCGGYSDKIIKNEMWVKKGDLIGHSGTTGSNSKGDPHISFSFIINNENLSEKEKKLCDLQIKKNFKQKECKKWSPLHCQQCYYAPEARKDIIWENFPSDNSDFYLLPIIQKKYLKAIGYYN